MSKHFDAKKCKQASKNVEACLHFLASKYSLTQIGMQYKSNRVAYLIRKPIASQ